MKILALILVIAAFIQSTILPIDLVLIILIVRSLLLAEKTNLYLAFALGLLVSHLSFNTLGFISILYLILVELIHMLTKSPISRHILVVVPLVLILSSINTIAISLLLHQSIQLWPKVFIESLLSLPIFFLIKIWEERFVIRKEIKLRV